MENNNKENTTGRRGHGFIKKQSQKKKQCRFCIEKMKEIDWKQTQLLKMFTTDTGRIIPRKITGLCAKHQRQLDKAIKRNRNLGLMPYTTMMRK
ncbi:MAG: 30S ribosomal protein S18 [Elusimicrobiales bacterium]|jgi:small subunit ribosomal protein S18|nr:30S ribosomal protein S18 [Elusimicrobiales bacterium]NLH40092.1 30S ribosomal protein S18 [Elusimicrobiota bacterium]